MMMFKSTVSALALLVAAMAVTSATARINEQQPDDRSNFFFRFFGRGDQSYEKELTLTIRNLAYAQPFAPFFVMVHNGDAEPIFTAGEEALPELGILAESGDPSMLVSHYMNNTEGVLSVMAVATMGDNPLLEPMETVSFTVTVTSDYPYVSIASMAVNTNDCFAAIKGMKLEGGKTYFANGYDSGTEENNESCMSVPGPACGGTAVSGNGEGFVHIHRGVHGMLNGTAGDLDVDTYDWRNPMLAIMVE